jgi:predicted phage-related endonuclease
MAKLSEQHPIEAELAKRLLEPYRALDRQIHLWEERADELEMKICEALMEAYYKGAADFVEAP